MSGSDDNKPKRLDAFFTKEGREGKSYFTKVGAAFEHKDGQGYNLKLDAQTPDGKYVLRTPRERIQNAQNQAGSSQSRDQGHNR